MKDNWRSWAVAAIVFSLLAVVGWAYRGDARQLIGGSVAGVSAAVFPDQFGPYPALYLPAVLAYSTPTAVVPPTPTLLPPATLHVGLSMRWDGSGYIYFDGYAWRPGTHDTRAVDQQVDADTVRVAGALWFSPNPLDFKNESWYCHYNTITNHRELCSSVSDPIWKWGHPWIMPADIVLANGQRATIDGQVFNVTGPHAMLTGNGDEVHFWRLENRDRFLMVYSGGEWKQYVESGDAVLFHEVGSGILLYDNVKRTYYKNDHSTSNYVQYESLLSTREGRMTIPADLRGPTTDSPAQAVELSDEAMAHLLAGAGLSIAEVGPVGNAR